MRFEKNAPFILMVNPSLGTKNFQREDRFRSYLSLGTLASALRDKSFLKNFAVRSKRREILIEKEEAYPSIQVKVVNLSAKPSEESVLQYLETAIKDTGIQPKIICATATSAQLKEVKEVGAAARAIVPSALRVIGGPHASVLPEPFLRDSEFQVACFGEGVETLTDLALSVFVAGETIPANVSGIAFKDDKDEIRVNPPRRFLFSLDQYPFPSDSLELFVDDLGEWEKNSRELVYLLAGAGCPYRCAFCAQHAIHRGGVRERSAENIFAEMKKLHTLGFRKFAIVQETFLMSRARVERFCELIENSGLSLEWTIEARADQLTLDLLWRMKTAGLKFVQIGLESGDQALLNRMGKGIGLDTVKKVRDWCERLDIHTVYYMLVGLPGQDWQSILKSALFLKENPPYNRLTMHVSVSVAIPYPGTKIAEEGTIRLIGDGESPGDWPDRNCAVQVDEEGAFVGKNFTETDDMTSQEIMEAYAYLDDYGEFLLHSKYDSARSGEERRKTRNYADRIFYMIERRTLRDLIIRAKADLGPEKYRTARSEILGRDGGEEDSFRKVTRSMGATSATLTTFLTRIKFCNGFPTMKCLSVSNRIRWMKICAIACIGIAVKPNRISFSDDNEACGKDLESAIERVPENRLDHILEKMDAGTLIEGGAGEGFIQGNLFKLFGISFRSEGEAVLRVMAF